MRHLYIIGNGFDIHHKINTGYLQFREWLEINNTSVLMTIDELFGFCNNNWWKEFEKNLANAIISDIVQEEVTENYPDFGSDAFRDREWYDAEHAVENRLSYAYDDIRSAFQEWITNLEKGDKSRKIKISTKNSLFLSFNYTNTLEYLYGINNKDILYIHGKAGCEDELVLGHGASYNDIQKLLNNSYPTNLEEGDDFITQRAKDAAICGVLNQKKDVTKIIKKNEDWFKKLKDVTHVHFYGHSFGDVDLPYFRKILSSVSPTAHIEISAYCEKDKITVDNFMSDENIGKNRYKIINLEDKLMTRIPLKLLHAITLILTWATLSPVFVYLAKRWESISKKLRTFLLLISPLMIVVYIVFCLAVYCVYDSYHRKYRFADNQAIERITGIKFPKLKLVDYVKGASSFTGDFNDSLTLKMQEPVSDATCNYLDSLISSGNKEWTKRDGEYNFSIMWGNGMPAPEGEHDNEDIAFSLSFTEGSKTISINYGYW